MIIKTVKRIVSILPKELQQDLKIRHYKRLVTSGKFDAGEIEFDNLENWISEGDWVLDIGANIGQYAYKMSKLVGRKGRVIAFEPIPDTFRILSRNMQYASHQNITLMNLAVSEATATISMEIPISDTQLNNYYMAKITNKVSDNQEVVMSINIDSLNIPNKISLIKIDVEGHEKIALNGMIDLLKRDHPTLIVEGDDNQVEELLVGLGYSFEKYKNSPNRVYKIK